jgi:hypothetical protein
VTTTLVSPDMVGRREEMEALDGALARTGLTELRRSAARRTARWKGLFFSGSGWVARGAAESAVVGGAC